MKGGARGSRAPSAMSAPPSISLCMIVKDEEANLGACLESARDLVDEICVVDTGSSDATVRIAREHGARVRDVAWNDSFAEARNHSLDMARGEWILILDADERLAPESHGPLRRLAAGERDTPARGREPRIAVIAAHARLIDHLGGGATRASWVARFFRNAPDHRFVGAIHNRLGPAFDERAARPENKIVLCDDFLIEHFGYRPEVWDAKQKTARTVRLYERALAEDPDDLYVRYKHADFLRGQPDRTAALEALDELCDRIAALSPAQRRRFAWYTESFALCAQELLNAGRVKEASRRLEQGTYCVPTANFWFVYGLWCLQAELWEDALSAFEACRSVEGVARIQAPASGVDTWKSALGMMRALRGSGRNEEALELGRAELRANPDWVQLATELDNWPRASAST